MKSDKELKEMSTNEQLVAVLKDIRDILNSRIQ